MEGNSVSGETILNLNVVCCPDSYWLAFRSALLQHFLVKEMERLLEGLLWKERDWLTAVHGQQDEPYLLVNTSIRLGMPYRSLNQNLFCFSLSKAFFLCLCLYANPVGVLLRKCFGLEIRWDFQLLACIYFRSTFGWLAGGEIIVCPIMMQLIKLCI